MHLSDAIRRACLWEATARKPGNVHPQAAFEDLCYQDFVESADAAAPCLALTAYVGVGEAVRNAVRATRERVRTNTNLGISLLLAPLAAVPGKVSISQGIWQVLRSLTLPTARPFILTGIRIASSLAVISALVAEYFGGPRGGLGAQISTSAASSAYARAWAYVVASIALGLLFYLVTLGLERMLQRHVPRGSRR